jgi:hypothetical protein
MTRYENLFAIAQTLETYPGVEVDKLEQNADLLTFKCCDEASLALIAFCVDETNDSWRIEAKCDSGDYSTIWYWLIPGSDETIDRESLSLAKHLKEELTEHYPIVKNKSENYQGMGIADLSLVTVKQMSQELDRRGISYALVWKREGDDGLLFKAHGGTAELLKMLEQARIWTHKNV